MVAPLCLAIGIGVAALAVAAGVAFFCLQTRRGCSEGLAPFLAYLCTDQGKQYTAQVFSVTASGKVDVYSAPVRLREITKAESLWTVEELAACVPGQLMPDYQNPAESRHY